MAKPIVPPVAVFTLSAAVATALGAAATTLANADTVFESAIGTVSTEVARIMGATPSFAHWELVRDGFVADYASARGCKPETARMRWVAIAREMAEEFALEKPIKPTEAAEKKAVERKGADLKAAELIKDQGATSAQAIMEIASKTPGLAKGTVAALGKAAQAAAQLAQKDASAVAKEAAKNLREVLRKTNAKLELAALREVHAFIEARQAAGWIVEKV